MKMYCVEERTKTKYVPGTKVVYKIKGNRRILKFKCASCGIMKHSFISNEKQVGLLNIHNLIGKLPRAKGGFALPPHISAEPYYPFYKQLDANDYPLPGQETYNQVVVIALKHDICYRDHENINKKGKTKCDKAVLDNRFENLQIESNYHKKSLKMHV